MELLGFLVIVLIALAVIDGLAVVFGRDSREDFDEDNYNSSARSFASWSR